MQIGGFIVDSRSTQSGSLQPGEWLAREEARRAVAIGSTGAAGDERWMAIKNTRAWGPIPAVWMPPRGFEGRIWRRGGSVACGSVLAVDIASPAAAGGERGTMSASNMVGICVERGG
jgi:hypothetical protein